MRDVAGRDALSVRSRTDGSRSEAYSRSLERPATAIDMLTGTLPDRWSRIPMRNAFRGSRVARHPVLPLSIAAVLAVAFFALGASRQAAAEVVVPPLPLPGPYPVACSNVAQDFTRMAPGEDVQNIWEGVPRDDGAP